MSKLDEKQIEKTHKSAAGQEDKAFEEWVSQRVLDETAEMINGLENDPDLDDFEPSEELFQKIVGIAKERGLLAEDDETTEDEADEIVEKIELSEIVKEENVTTEDETFQKLENMSAKKGILYFKHKRFVMKWAAMIAVTLVGIFGISMSSQANRAFVMQKMDEIFGNDVNTKLNNTGDTIPSSVNEEEDRKSIETFLNVKVPAFYYLPDGTTYDTYHLDKDAHAAYMRYKYQNKYLYFQILENHSESSGIYRNNQGTMVDYLSNEWCNSKIELWKIEEEGDEMPVYLAQWDYKNSYFCISGKIQEYDMRQIIENMIY